MLQEGTKNAKEPDTMARVIMRAIKAPKPKNVYSCNHNLSMKFMSCLPSKWVDAIFYQMFKA